LQQDDGHSRVLSAVAPLWHPTKHVFPITDSRMGQRTCASSFIKFLTREVIPFSRFYDKDATGPSNRTQRRVVIVSIA
jgi:hypothetical protein